jgi:fructose/tagatose bisphosphate aldolase
MFSKRPRVFFPKRCGIRRLSYRCIHPCIVKVFVLFRNEATFQSAKRQVFIGLLCYTPTMHQDTSSLSDALSKSLIYDQGNIRILDQYTLQQTDIDTLITHAIFAENETVKATSRSIIREVAKALGVISASIYPLYKAFGEKAVSGFTVPACNIRTLTYDTARIVFRLANEHKIGPVIFEIARSEMDYTLQRPDEYAICVLAAAIKEGYRGPVFMQGDHFQLSKRRFTESRETEVGKIKSLIDEAINASFYNIDIDASTLVELEKADLHEQQRNNFEVTALLTEYIRSHEKNDMQISIGGEIGHIGGKNSTVLDFEAFMDGYLALVKSPGISKVSVQTGTSHGGVPLPDGTMATIDLDFSVLQDVGEVARTKYGLGGAVQHGASTLPHTLFDQFPKVGTLEIHLATGFQNIVYDTMPEALRQEIYTWIKENLANEREDGWSDEQFTYKLRKKALGPFKKRLWELTQDEKQPIITALTQQFTLLFEKLNIYNTRDIVLQYVT